MVTDSTSATSVNVVRFPEQNKSTTAAKDEYVLGIQQFCATRQLAETLSREEIGAMSAFNRIDAQRKSIIINLAHYYRLHQRADVAPGILVIMTLLSDNENGACTLSQVTLGKIFDRSPTAIRDAQKRLKDENMLVMGRGRYPASYPVIPRIVTAHYNHMTWLIGAICDEPKALNVPAGLADCQSAGGSCGLDQSAGGSCGLDGVNPPDNEFQSARPAGDYFTKEEREEREDNIYSSKPHRKVASFATASAAAAIAMGITAAAADVHQVELPIDQPPVTQSETVDIEEAAASYTHDFECFWEIYPRKTGKGAAFKSWKRLKMPQRRKAYVALKQQLENLKAKASDRRGNFCPHPATWINQGRFDDEVEQEQPIQETFQSNYSASGHYIGRTI